MAAEDKNVARELRTMKRHLRELTKVVRICVREIDERVATRQDIPRDLSAWFGTLANVLEMENDRARHFGLGEKLSAKKR